MYQGLWQEWHNLAKIVRILAVYLSVPHFKRISASSLFSFFTRFQRQDWKVFGVRGASLNRRFSIKNVLAFLGILAFLWHLRFPSNSSPKGRHLLIFIDKWSRPLCEPWNSSVGLMRGICSVICIKPAPKTTSGQPRIMTGEEWPFLSSNQRVMVSGETRNCW